MSIKQTSTNGQLSLKNPDKILSAQPFPVAAIGASAGGIEAISILLEHLAPDNGMVYVIIQHLSPDHESILPEIFERKTNMPVHRVINGMKIEPDNIYVIPPDTYMSIIDGHLTLSPRGKTKLFYHPIDDFLIALAEVYQNKAIGIILSGTATDGTAGLKAIKSEGGITFAQDDSAKFKGMPRSASDSGQVDFILPPEKIAGELTSIGKLPYLSRPASEVVKQEEIELKDILTILYHKRDVDFSLYKETTIYRRILRRIALHRLKKIQDYTDMLRANDDEVNLLYNDLLINVTSFFRDSDVFTALSKKILPAQVKGRSASDPIRIWITACSTGEEAYSIAMCMFEFLTKRSLVLSFQIFATDINELAIEKARTGVYAKNALYNISPQRLKNYFVKLDGHYQVIKAIRDVCVFATHNLLADPPFSRIDVISCQNVMIYLENFSQNKILEAFHYALKPNGFLILGKSESVGEASQLFDQADKHFKLFTKKDGISHIPLDFTMHKHRVFPTENWGKEKEPVPVSKETDVERETDKILLSRYVPASVLINKDLYIVRFNGPTSDYLQPSSGKASLNLLKMVKDEFLFDLRSMIATVKKSGQAATKTDVKFDKNGSPTHVTLEVAPVQSATKETYYLILFREQPGIGNSNNEELPPLPANKRSLQDKDSRIIRLEKELADAREQMKSLSEEFEATREELQSSNEEVLSSNEELQSINEELETSKEELQSTNEELTTINEELQHRNDDLKEAFDYRQAIVETIREPLIVLSNDLRIITVNKAFHESFKTLADQTEGLLLYEIANGQWNIPALKKQLNDILNNKTNIKYFEITTALSDLGQRTLLLNAIRMGDDNTKKGKILLVLEDVTERRKAEQDLKRAHDQNLNILNSISDVFISVDNTWRYTFVNKEAEQFIGKKAKDVLGKNMWEIMPAYANTEFYVQLINTMKTREASEFEFYDEASRQWYNYRLYPSRETLSVYANNITEHKLSIDLINQSKERYQTFISKSTEGIWRFEVQKPVSVKFSKDVQINQLLKSAYLAECNDTIAKMYGYTKAQDITGNSLEEMIALSGIKNYLHQFISSNYLLSDVELHETDKDGSEKYFLTNLVGIVENGAIKRIWGTQRDITEAKHAELRLKSTQQKLSLALSIGSVATWIWNIKENVIEWTTEQQLLYGMIKCPDLCSYNDWISLIHPDDTIEVQKQIKDAVAKKKDLSVEFRVVWPDESLHWILFKANPGYDDKGHPLQMAGVNIDITERKMLEKQKDEFIVIASHELKTPVTSIKAYSEILNDMLEETNNARTSGIAKKLDQQVDRLTNLIKDLLDVTRISGGLLQLKHSYFDFSQLVNEVVGDMQQTTLKHTLEKEVNVIRQVWADRNKIAEVLVNLISNAVKYSPNGGRIIISAFMEQAMLVVSVKDFGIGLAKNNLQKIFDRFFRVNDSTINTFPGLGLGLYICSEIIKRHNGTIWVTSIKDQGAEFHFTLPLGA